MLVDSGGRFWYLASKILRLLAASEKITPILTAVDRARIVPMLLLADVWSRNSVLNLATSKISDVRR